MDTNEHECLRKGEKKTTVDADDTNVWRMKRGENHDAEILSVMIRLNPWLKLARLPLRSLLPVAVLPSMLLFPVAPFSGFFTFVSIGVHSWLDVCACGRNTRGADALFESQLE